MYLREMPQIKDTNLMVWLQEAWQVINVNQGQDIEVTTVVGADTEFAVNHDLERIPTSVQVLVTENQTDAYIEVKPSGTTWTDRIVYLKCNTATATLKVRVL